MSDNIIIIEDSNGKKTEYIEIDTFKKSKNTYIVLLDINNKHDDTDNVLLIKLNHKKNNNEHIIITEKKELAKVINLFLKRWNHTRKISFINT